MNERRIARLQETIKARVAEVVAYEMADPRRGLITITRVKIDKDLNHCIVFWSILGDERERTRNAEMLDHAAKHVQHEVAEILHTRTVPRVKFVFDESIAGAIRVNELIKRIGDEQRKKDGNVPESDPPR